MAQRAEETLHSVKRTIEVTKVYQVEVKVNNPTVKGYDSEMQMLLDCAAHDFDHRNNIPVLHIEEGGVRYLTSELTSVEIIHQEEE